MAWRAEAGRTARRLRWQGLAGLAMAAPVSMLAPGTGPGWWLTAAPCGVLAALSAHLLFDAALLRLAAAQKTEAGGLAAIDARLARLGLRRDGTDPRPLPPRLAGCRRLLRRQGTALAIGAVFVLIHWLHGAVST